MAALRGRRLFLLVWAAAAAWALAHLDRGWFAADAGTLGQAAQRVIAGELPHRDFVDTYTGGLAFLDAAAFRASGDGVMTMRWVVFLAFVAWVPAVWVIARRAAGRALAAGATLLAAAWTLPVYAEGMPSWYNLFLATFGVAALLRWEKRPHPVWLFAAGLCGGLSILFKVVGLYFVAVGLLFLIRAEAVEEARAPAPSSAPARDGAYRTLVIAGVVALAAAVAVLVARAMGFRFFFLYGVPPLAGVAALLPWALRRGAGGSAHRLRTYLRLAAPFLAGVALPLALFLVPYVASGSVHDLLVGVFVLPGRRLERVGMAGPAGPWFQALPAALLVALILRPPPAPTRMGRLAGAGAGLLLGGGLALAGGDATYSWVFRTLLWLPPLACLGALATLLRRGRRAPPELPLLLAAFGLVGLVQVPFAAPAYFFYAAPLMVLLAVACVGTDRRRVPWMEGVVAAALAFTVLRLNPGFSPDLGFRYRPEASAAPLALQRAMGVRVSPEDKADYEGVVELVERLQPGGVLYAAPDCPEIYFLTGLRNPTRTLFEFLDDPTEGAPGLLDTLEAAGVRVLVIRPSPLFSDPLDPELLGQLERRYPMGRRIGRFLVAWKPEAAGG